MAHSMEAAAGVDSAAWEQLDLRDAARFVATEARQAQEDAWKGAKLDNRQVFGAREAQGLHGLRLRAAVRSLHRARAVAAGLGQPGSRLYGWMMTDIARKVMEFEGSAGPLMEFACSFRPVPPHGSTSGGLVVCARKRPLLHFELEADGWDAVEVCGRESAMICHDGKIHRSGRSLSMVHRRFPLHRVWPASATTEDVYRDEVASLLTSSLAGGGATVLCTGQTGTGKTHTMRGVADCLARDLHGRGGLSVEFFEIYGKRCVDLLADGAEVRLRTDHEDVVRVCGQRRAELPDGSGLAEVLRGALALRACERTERNEASSRSHAVCTLSLASGGTLRLVDLAGSERNFETTKMSAQQHKDSAEINSSLMALKDCFRAHAALQRGERAMMPFRRSRLTRVLRDCFVDMSHKTVVIGTVSPAAVDVIHTANTLNHLAMLSKPLADAASHLTVSVAITADGAKSFKGTPVADWSTADVMAWLAEVDNGRYSHVVVPPDLDGSRLLSMGEAGLAELFEGALRQARGDNEGSAWTVSAHSVGQRIGRAIFAAARREAALEARRAALAGETGRRETRFAGPTFGWFGEHDLRAAPREVPEDREEAEEA